MDLDLLPPLGLFALGLLLPIVVFSKLNLSTSKPKPNEPSRNVPSRPAPVR